MAAEKKSILYRFPKTRPPLPEALEAIYARHYRANREGDTPAASMSQRMESWMHKQVAGDLGSPHELQKTTLELGAGTLNQLEYEPDVGYYDIVEPFVELYENASGLERVRNIYADISEVPAGNRYDRITSVAVLEHICNLPEVIARCGLLLGSDGVFRASIPSEGVFLWTMGWKLTTGLEFRIRYGLDYGALMRHEHVNTASEIEQVLQFFFRDMQCRVFGLTKSISFYRFYVCTNPIRRKCREYLRGCPEISWMMSRSDLP